MRKRAAAAGLEGDWSAHSLRSGYVTSACAAREPITRVADQSRHASLDMLLRYARHAARYDGHSGASFL